jgi:hypothetical protein
VKFTYISTPHNKCGGTKAQQINLTYNMTTCHANYQTHKLYILFKQNHCNKPSVASVVANNGSFVGHMFYGMLTNADDVTSWAATHSMRQVLHKDEDFALEFSVYFNTKNMQLNFFFFKFHGSKCSHLPAFHLCDMPIKMSNNSHI